jgi:hypothetical protein
LALNKSRYYLPDLLTFKDKIISNDLIDEATKWLCVKVNEFKDVNRITLDAIAKSSQFKEHLVDRLNREYFN